MFHFSINCTYYRNLSIAHMQVCACDSADCETCEAEKEAILSATRWFDQDKDIHIDTHSNTESDSQSYIHAGSEEDSETHIYKNTGEDGLTTFRGQMLQICPQLDKTRQVTFICFKVIQSPTSGIGCSLSVPSREGRLFVYGRSDAAGFAGSRDPHIFSQ